MFFKYTGTLLTSLWHFSQFIFHQCLWEGFKNRCPIWNRLHRIYLIHRILWKYMETITHIEVIGYLIGHFRPITSTTEPAIFFFLYQRFSLGFFVLKANPSLTKAKTFFFFFFFQSLDQKSKLPFTGGNWPAFSNAIPEWMFVK